MQRILLGQFTLLFFGVYRQLTNAVRRLWLCKPDSFGNCTVKEFTFGESFFRSRLYLCMFILNINAHLKWFSSENLSIFRQCEDCFLLCSGFYSAQVLAPTRWHWNRSLLFAMCNIILYTWRWFYFHLPLFRSFSQYMCVGLNVSLVAIWIQNIHSINSTNHCICGGIKPLFCLNHFPFSLYKLNLNNQIR